MSAADRERLEAIVRPVVGLYVLRVAEAPHLRASAQSMTRLVQEILRRGCMVQVSPSVGLGLSRAQQWLVDVEWIWQQLDRELGPLARHVLVFRLTRPQKTELSSFARIAHDITAICRTMGRPDVLVLEQAEVLYRAALVHVAALLSARGIGRDLPAEDVSTSERSLYRPWSEPQSQHGLIAVGQRLQRLARRRRRRRLVADRRRDVTHGARV